MIDLQSLTTPGQGRRNRLTALIWGASGCGKTVLAGTAPGKKLVLNWDPDGHISLTPFADECSVWDLSSESPKVTGGFKDSNSKEAKELIQLLKEGEFDTVISDSVTSFGELALIHGVAGASATPKGKDSTIEDPGYSGFGRKNTYVLQYIRTLLRVTGQAERPTNCIFLGHEGAPERDKQGAVIEIPMMLGSNLKGTAPIPLSEVWIMTDMNGRRELAVRNKGLRKGGKTRMFKTTSKRVSFEWKFNVDTMKGEGIRDWMKQWEENGYMKIDLPE